MVAKQIQGAVSLSGEGRAFGWEWNAFGGYGLGKPQLYPCLGWRLSS